MAPYTKKDIDAIIAVLKYAESVLNNEAHDDDDYAKRMEQAIEIVSLFPYKPEK